VYKCGECGNVIEVLHRGSGELRCCEREMVLLEAKMENEGREKHVPVVEKSADGVKVKVGSVPHPMEENHYIEWIEVRAGREICRKFLSPGEKPEAEFCIHGRIEVRSYCNLHGLWKGEQ